MSRWWGADERGRPVLKDDLLNKCLGADHRAAHCLNYPCGQCFGGRQGMAGALPGQDVFNGQPGVFCDPPGRAADAFLAATPQFVNELNRRRQPYFAGKFATVGGVSRRWQFARSQRER